MGVEKAKRYLLTGDEIPAPTAAEIGMILETVPDERLQGLVEEWQEAVRLLCAKKAQAPQAEGGEAEAAPGQVQ